MTVAALQGWFLSSEGFVSSTCASSNVTQLTIVTAAVAKRRRRAVRQSMTLSITQSTTTGILTVSSAMHLVIATAKKSLLVTLRPRK